MVNGNLKNSDNMTKQKKFDCPLCTKSYQSFRDLDIHGYKIHDLRFDWEYKIIIINACQVCGSRKSKDMIYTGDGTKLVICLNCKNRYRVKDPDETHKSN